MYQGLRVEGFRGIRTLTIENPRLLNLFVGRNNTGKTSLLEALFLLGAATSPYAATMVAQLRGQRLGTGSADPIWRPLFHGMDPTKKILLSGRWRGESVDRSLVIQATRLQKVGGGTQDKGGGVVSTTNEFVVGGLRFHYVAASGLEQTTEAVFQEDAGQILAPAREREDFARTTYLSARAYSLISRDAEQFSSLLKAKREADVLDAVRLIEPRVQRIEVLSDSAGPSVYVDLGLDALVPLAVCGEGFVRLFSIIVELTASQGGVLLIDEIDNGLHHSVMDSLWRVLAKLSRKHGVQLFATTHSDEMLRSALTSLKDDAEALGLFRLDLLDGAHRVAAYGADAKEAVLSEGFEVRG